jgi:diaminopimelate epimerase
MIHFHKYQGTGNDFILIDNREQQLQLNKAQIAFLCHRRFGIGADGLMLLGQADGYDFTMTYYNADGGESTMCGNGGRCITAFAKELDLVKDKAFFRAIDGDHHAVIDEDGIVALEMKDVSGITHFPTHSILDTGSPHYVLWTADVDQTDVVGEGRRIRYSDAFMPAGINVNFAQQDGGLLRVRTYERGVEDETYSCGTGVTACAIAATKEQSGTFRAQVETPGGVLFVSFDKPEAGEARNVVLTGPAQFVFTGQVEAPLV